MSEAIRLGSQSALLDQAEETLDLDMYQKIESTSNPDPMRMAAIAQNLGRDVDRGKWLTKAAEAGNLEAMEDLIESVDKDNLERCWMWIFFSRLLDHDLSLDRYIAINEDGSLHDDDIGGPMYVGGTGGIDPSAIEEDSKARAEHAAKELLKHLGRG